MSDRVSVKRKEFQSFLAENQKLIDRSQALISEIDRLGKENKQMRDELEASRAKLRSLESSMAAMSQSDNALKKAPTITSTELIKCRYCKAEVPRERLICPKCGMPARPL